MTTSAIDVPLYEPWDEGAHPPLDSPGYLSTKLRAPFNAPVDLPQRLTEVTGPLFGETLVSELDADLTRQHDGEPQGQRIVLHGRVLDGAGRPIARQPGGDLAGERRRPLPPHAGQLAGAARPELHRPGPHGHGRRRLVPVHDHPAGGLPVAEPRQRLAAGAHPLLAARPCVHAAARHADVLPGRSALLPGPDHERGARGRAAADGVQLRPRAHAPGVGPRVPLGRRAPGSGVDAVRARAGQPRRREEDDA